MVSKVDNIGFTMVTENFDLARAMNINEQTTLLLVLWI